MRIPLKANMIQMPKNELLQQTPELIWRGAKATNWKLVFLHVAATPPLLTTYWVVQSQGLRSKLPIMATKLYRVPFPYADRLRDYEISRQLDLAHVLAVILAGFVAAYWVLLVRYALYGTQLDKTDPRMNKQAYNAFVCTIGGALLIGDSVAFYFGVADNAQGLWADPSPLIPLITTLMYMALLTALAVLHVQLTVSHAYRHAEIPEQSDEGLQELEEDDEELEELRRTAEQLEQQVNESNSKASSATPKRAS